MMNLPRASSPCRACGERLSPLDEEPGDAALNQLCGFNVVRALNVLHELQHQVHGEPEKAAGVAEATRRLLQLRELAGPERLSQLESFESLRELLPVLRQFIEKASAAASRDVRGLLGNVRLQRGGLVEQRLRQQPPGLTVAVARRALSLERYLGALERQWSFDSVGRTLPGTLHTGRPLMRSLGFVEAALADGGFSENQIAAMGLDEQLGKADQRKGRVHQRLRAERKRQAQANEVLREDLSGVLSTVPRVGKRGRSPKSK